MKNDKKPKISVIMGMYNCEHTLEQSLDSLLNQTYKDFEVIMCDDGSSDNTYNIAKLYSKRYNKKFILLKNERNMGLNYTLNKCLKAAKGYYIARMDGDDISLPHRFEKEVSFLDNNPEFDIVSSSMIHFDETGEWGIGNPKKIPLKEDLIKGTPFAHAACMVKHECFKAVGGYNISKRLLRVEDYHLWIKMYSMGYKGYNIQEPLYKMRDNRNAAGRRNFISRVNETYVKFIAIRTLRLSFMYVPIALKPIIIGLLPKELYIVLHKRKLRKIFY